MSSKPRELWALKSRYGYVRDPHYRTALNTLFFKSRRDADAWLQDNDYWLTQKAQPVKVWVRIEERVL